MDKIDNTTREKQNILEEYYNKIENIKNEIKQLEEKNICYVIINFSYIIYSGPYPEREFICMMWILEYIV